MDKHNSSNINRDMDGAQFDAVTVTVPVGIADQVTDLVERYNREHAKVAASIRITCGDAETTMHYKPLIDKCDAGVFVDGIVQAIKRYIGAQDDSNPDV